MSNNNNATKEYRASTGRRDARLQVIPTLENITEIELDEEDQQSPRNSVYNMISSSQNNVSQRINYVNAESEENVIELEAISSSKVLNPQSPASRQNIKSKSSQIFSLFAMNLPTSPATSMESIAEDDSSCCNKVICCPDIIRRQDVHKNCFNKIWCFDYATVFKILAHTMILVIFWGWLALWLGDLAWPGGKIFDLLFLTLIGYLFGWSLSYIPYLRLPPIVGMLLVGMIARNVYRNGKPLYQVAPHVDLVTLPKQDQHDQDHRSDLDYTTAGNIRSFCLTFVMMRAGLQIDARKLARHRRTICRLGIVPGSVECIVVAIAAWNLIDVDINETTIKPLPFIYCLMTGAIVAVMSPVTAIQCALELEEQGYSKAIATIIYTATSIDSVYMVSLFSVFHSFALRLWSDDSSKHHMKKSFQSTYALVAGALIGLSFGIVLTFFPHRQSPFVLWFRIINLNLACIFCTCWGYSVANIGAGLMGTCATCFVALTGWKIIDKDFKDAKRVRMITGMLWNIAQPFLVVGIGVEIDFGEWKIERVMWQICVLAIGLFSRCLSAMFVAHRHEISWNESIFLGLAWTPKGHIQAAIAPLAYQTLHMLYNKKTNPKRKFKEEMKYAQVLIMISFMTVIIMGPMGSMLMMGLGPRLLTKHQHHHLPGMSNVITNSLSFLVEEFLDFQPNPQRPQVRDEIPTITDTSCCLTIRILPKRIRNMDATERIVKKFDFTWMNLFSVLGSIFMIVILWGTARVLFGNAINPGQPVFDIYILYICAYVIGWSMTFIPGLHLPPTLGMILVGLLARNIEIHGQPLYDIRANLSSKSAVMLRNFCLVFIMMRCGLQMNATSLKRHKAIIMMIAFGPSTVEMCVMAYVGCNILNYPWSWAFLAGAICATTSPVVTGHCVLTLEERGYGGSMSHILCASTAIDSTQIVTIYSICYAFVFGEDEHSIVMKGLRTTILNLTIGVFVGTGFGILFTFIPHRGQIHVYRYRVLVITLASLFMCSLAVYMEVHGAGFLAIIILCFVSSAGWRIISTNFNSHPLRTFVKFVWHFSQPLIISTVAAEINLKSWDPNRAIKHLICISIGVISRCLAAFMITKGQNFDQKERAFISLATIPKGTVQAALAPVSFERSFQKLEDLNNNLTSLVSNLVNSMTQEEAEIIGKLQLDYDNRVEKIMKKIATSGDMMNMSLLSIIILAPLGAFLLMTMGPHLLRPTPSNAVLSYSSVGHRDSNHDVPNQAPANFK